MRGYTGDRYDGMPVFIREDYEAAHAGESELERLCDLTGIYRRDVHEARSDAERLDKRFLYNEGDEFRDMLLRGGVSLTALWKPYQRGFVHVITGEYALTGARPDRDSRPAWAIRTHRVPETTEQCRREFSDALTNLMFGLIAVATMIP